MTNSDTESDDDILSCNHANDEFNHQDLDNDTVMADEFSDDEDEQHVDDDNDDDSLINGEHPSFYEGVNLRCMKSLKQFYKAEWKLQPLPLYRVSFPILEYYIASEREEQKKANQEWSKLTQTQQKEIRALIPGADCNCCKKLPRADMGKKRKTRKSRRLLKEAPAEVIVTSMGHGGSDARAAANKSGSKRKPKQKAMQYALSTERSGGAPARDAIITACMATIKACTMGTKPPRIDASTGQPSFDQSVPRNRSMFVNLNNCVQSRSMKASTKVFYVSICSCIHCLETFKRVAWRAVS